VEAFVSYTVGGLFFGAAYAIAASGLVLTYTTTRVFNLAHGATSMVMAFVYWQLHVQAKIPTLLAIALVLLVIAPLYALMLERFVMRGLGEAPVSVALVVTVGLFMILVGVAQQFWPADTYRSVDYFFGYNSFSLFGAHVRYHYLITVVVSAVVAGALYVLLNRTRIGTAMRAAVDNRELLELFGASAGRISMLSWVVGSQLAALAGVLLVSYTGLDYFTLTFLVVASFAAAMLGRLTSLPLTYIGAMVLGLAGSYCRGYIHGGPLVQTGLQSSLPTFMLFLTLLFVPQVRLRVGQVKGILAANVPNRSRSAISGLGLIVVCALAASTLNATNLLRFGEGLSYGVIMLSLVLLTGYGGYVSLGQMTFVCVGAAVAAKMDSTSPLVLIYAILIAAAVGAIVALPVLRLTGLYLALATLAFAQLMDNLVFKADWMFGFGVTLHAKRVSLFGYDFSDTAAYDVFIAVVFVIIGLGLLVLRRGAIGRLLIALRDSPAACGTLGLNQRWFRVGVFSVSAGIAGLAGALLAGVHRYVTEADYVPLQSLPILLLAVVAGVTSISGAWLGGMMYMLLLVLQTTYKGAAGFLFLIIGVGAILLARDPNGLVNFFYRGVRRVVPSLPLPRRGQPVAVDVERPVEAQVAGHGVA